jgi:peptide chain release factor 1
LTVPNGFVPTIFQRTASPITDFKSYNLDQVLNGDLDAVIKALQEADTHLRLSRAGSAKP